MSDAIEIRPLAPGDAEQLTDCFERCYGSSYVVELFYDPAAIRSRMADGRVQSVVATTITGEIVGHMALVHPHLEARTVELGNTIVDPRYRGYGLAARLGAALVEACRAGGYVGFHHYPTTAHAIMQKLAVQAGGIETGVMLAYIPQGTDYRDLGGASARGRLAVVVVYQPLAPAPARVVFLPPRFETMSRAIYARAGLERVAGAPAERPASRATRLSCSLDARRRLLRIHVESVGADVSDRVDELVRGHPADVAHVDLLLCDCCASYAVEKLRERGFFFCALMPEFATSDVLRLQRLAAVPPELPDLVYAEAREILTSALADRASG